MDVTISFMPNTIGNGNARCHVKCVIHPQDDDPETLNNEYGSEKRRSRTLLRATGATAREAAACGCGGGSSQRAQAVAATARIKHTAHSCLPCHSGLCASS